MVRVIELQVVRSVEPLMVREDIKPLGHLFPEPIVRYLKCHCEES